MMGLQKLSYWQKPDSLIDVVSAVGPRFADQQLHMSTIFFKEIAQKSVRLLKNKETTTSAGHGA